MKSNNIFTRPMFGNWPAVGIIPTFDGRLRKPEQIEIAVRMAQAVATLIANSCFNPDGSPVRCVVSAPVGGTAELFEARQLFRRENVGSVLQVSPYWCYTAEVLFSDPEIPLAIIGFNGTERPGAVFSAAAMSHCLDQGIRAFLIYGKHVQPLDQVGELASDVAEKILHFVRVASVVANIKGRNYLSIGACSMGINGSVPSPDTFRKFGMGFQFCDMSEVAGRMKSGLYNPDELRMAIAWAEANCQMGFDPNTPLSPHDTSSILCDSVKMALIVQDMMRGNPSLPNIEKSLGFNAILAGFQGQRNWTDYYPNGDFMETILNTSWDWNGVRCPFIVATENDALNGAGMLFGYLLTHSAQVFADLRTYWSLEAVAAAAGGYQLEGVAQNGLLHNINSGPAALDGTGMQMADGKPTMKAWWDVTDIDVVACMRATTFHPADNIYFPGGGLSTRFATRGGMPVTAIRILREEDGQLVLHAVECETVSLPENVHNALDTRTNPTWPTTWVAPLRVDPYDVMNHWGSNHDVLVPGHRAGEFISLAALTGMSIGMTNVPVQEQLLPIQWAIHGSGHSTFNEIARRMGPLYRGR